MALRDLSDPEAVVAALDEFDELRRDAFLAKYGFGKARRYFLRRGAKFYDSKAIAAAAHGHQFGRALQNHELYGGVSSAVPKLRELGFQVVDEYRITPDDGTGPGGQVLLVVGTDYSWEELGETFGFEPGWLNRIGGMGSLPSTTRCSSSPTWAAESRSITTTTGMAPT